MAAVGREGDRGRPRWARTPICGDRPSGRFSDLVGAPGLAAAVSGYASAPGTTLGPVRPELAAATGLPRDCRVIAGIHDSNASFLPHLVARPAPFTVLSTGTWVIAMAAGAALDRLDPAADMLANVDARGEPVPTARFMGGARSSSLAGRGCAAGGGRPGRMSPRSWRQMRWRCRASYLAADRSWAARADPRRSRCRSGASRGTCGALCRVDRGRDAGKSRLDRAGDHRGRLSPQCRVLRSSGRTTPGQAIHATDDPSGTARGAWLLARWDERPDWPTTCAPRITMAYTVGLAAIVRAG